VASKIGQTERHYYYAGQTVIEEYNVNSAGVESLARYHINGGQYIDERVVSYDVKSDGSAVPTYYLAGDNFSVIGTGSADGQTIRPLNYSPTGQFTGGGMRSCNLDQDSANDVDSADFTLLEGCFSGPDVPVTTGPTCQIGEAADIDRDGDVDGSDYIIFQTCMSGTDVPASAACLGQGVSPEDSGIATMHGLTVDVLPDGKALLYARARHYDMKHGRWLQRDPKGYVDGPNLYEAFGGNPLVNLDPSGTDITTLMGLWFQMHQPDPPPEVKLLRTAMQAGGMVGELPVAVEQRAIGLFIDTNGKTPEQYRAKFKDEVYHTARGAVLLKASWDPQAALILGLTDPQLASALTPQANWELNVLGPAQGVANAAQGVQDIAFGLANLAIAGAKHNNLVLFILIPDDVAITSPEWSRDVALRESDWVHNVSTRMAGESGFFLITVGLGEVLTPTRAAAGPANAGRSLKVLNPEFTPDTAKVMQNIVTRIEGDIVRQPVIIRSVLNRAEYEALKAGGREYGRIYGTAIERMAAEQVAADPALRDLFSYVARVQDPLTGRFMTSPDFFGWEAGRIRFLDITTQRQVAAHLRRAWAQIENMIIHSGGKGIIFP